VVLNVAMGTIALPCGSGSRRTSRTPAHLSQEGQSCLLGRDRPAAFGTGYTQGPQKRLAFLPEQHTDFVFPIVGEELGFVGVMVALSLFLALFLALLRIARRATDSFSSLVTFGILGLFFTHVFENVGMTVNLMPITGIPLPFFSYGGSFLLACWIAVGMLVRISAEGRGRPEELGLA
jgi:rod shape determining protein RodA